MNSLKRYRHYFIFAGGGIMTILTVWFVVYIFNFLLSNFSKATNVEPPQNTAVKFDIEGFEKLNLMQK